MIIENNKSISKGAALKFVILLGIVSLFADMTYEGARSITGPNLANPWSKRNYCGNCRRIWGCYMTVNGKLPYIWH